MPYHAILMETGALYQTMYLAATALGLASCAIGAFPELATAKLLGVDSRDEAQVGMFALGTGDTGGPPNPQIVALRRDDTSPFTGGAPVGAVEFTFADGTKQVVPIAQLSLESDSAGTLRCRFLHRGEVADIGDDCRDDARRLLESRD
jgi:hypothetical protein